MERLLVSRHRSEVLAGYWSHWMKAKTVASQAFYWAELETDVRNRRFDGPEVERGQYRKLLTPKSA